ncbi:MAG TPA: hypothetical protein ENJ13_08020 [Chromatiales bacterium]|nr:hypothetical protein [Chromatiales bacterium]
MATTANIASATRPHSQDFPLVIHRLFDAKIEAFGYFSTILAAAKTGQFTVSETAKSVIISRLL